MTYVSWEWQVKKACEKKGFEIMPYGFEGGWVFVKNKDGRIFPIGEELVAKWVKEDDKDVPDSNKG